MEGPGPVRYKDYGRGSKIWIAIANEREMGEIVTSRENGMP